MYGEKIHSFFGATQQACKDFTPVFPDEGAGALISNLLKVTQLRSVKSRMKHSSRGLGSFPGLPFVLSQQVSARAKASR